METTLSSAAGLMSNTGIGFGEVSEGDFSCYSAPLKLYMSLLMVVGRLELFTVFLLSFLLFGTPTDPIPVDQIMSKFISLSSILTDLTLISILSPENRFSPVSFRIPCVPRDHIRNNHRKAERALSCPQRYFQVVRICRNL